MLIEKGIVKIAVLVSGNGTNLQALINAESRGELGSGKIVKVLSSKTNAFALTRAENAGIETEVVERKIFSNSHEFDNALLSVLQRCGADIIVLAGFMSILGNNFIDAYKDRIINVHPSLIPSFCGTGFYGLKVHEAALSRGVKLTGATVHFVNEIPDGGKIISQKAVGIYENDTPESLQKRVMEQAEWEILPKAVCMVCNSIMQD